MSDSRKLFNEQGFLSEEGKVYVADGFGKELRNLFKTAEINSDALIISSILKGMIDQVGSERANEVKNAHLLREDSQALAQVIPFPKKPKPLLDMRHIFFEELEPEPPAHA